MKKGFWSRFNIFTIKSAMKSEELKKTAAETDASVKNPGNLGKKAPKAALSEGKLFKAWGWVLPVLLGCVSGWFGMVCLEVALNGYSESFRPTAASASLVSAADEGSEAETMLAFLNYNPFNITPMPLPEEELDPEGPVITGSLATAVIRWTMPDTGVLLEDEGRQYVVLLDTSFDVYTLEEVNYLQAIFRKGEERVVKELLFSAKPSPSAPSQGSSQLVASNIPAGQQVIAPDPTRGTEGSISRDMINTLMENPFDELKKVRLRPAANEQGLQIQWINKDSILGQLGIQKGDVVRSINGIAFRNMRDITNSMNSLMDSDRFDVEVTRNGTPTSMQYAVR